LSAALLSALERLAGPDLAVAVELVGDSTGLMGEEADAVRKAIPKRQAEFAAGRRAARAALHTLGIAPQQIPVGPGRAPLWPHGLTGSLSHDAEFAIAVAARTAVTGGLGLDLAEDAPFPDALRGTVLPHPEEAPADALTARAIFSAKETFFKALYPSVGEHFYFDAARVQADLGSGRFTVELTRALGPCAKNDRFEGRIARAEGRIVTFLRLPA
jgi:4'-phosphopantetheinyl transferase EntD